jgi:hypothetical protein
MHTRADHRAFARIKKRRQRLKRRLAKKLPPVDKPIMETEMYCKGCVWGTFWRDCTLGVGVELGDHAPVRGYELLRDMETRPAAAAGAQDDGGEENVPEFARCDFCLCSMQDAACCTSRTKVVYFACQSCMTRAAQNRAFHRSSPTPHMLLRQLIDTPNISPPCLADIDRPCLQQLRQVASTAPPYKNSGPFFDKKIAAYLEFSSSQPGHVMSSV